MKKEFRIVALHALPLEGILLTLAPVFSERKRSDEPGEHIPNPERVIVGPGVQSEDEKMMQTMMKGVFDELDRRFGAARSESSFLTLPLTKEEYDGLGKPLVNQVVTLSVEKADGEP